MNIHSWHTLADRQRYKVVRSDTCADVPGEIIEANADSGHCEMLVRRAGPDHTITETKEVHEFGPHGLQVVTRAR